MIRGIAAITIALIVLLQSQSHDQGDGYGGNP